MIENYTFSGKIAWASVTKPNKYDKFSLNFYPQGGEDRKAIKATGIRNGIKEDDGAKSGVEGFFYVFRSEAQPSVTDSDGNPVTVLIGNGSEADITISVEKFNTKDYGEVTRSKLVSVVVTKLIPYEKPAEATGTAETLPV
jgi:hypothetical protein